MEHFFDKTIERPGYRLHQLEIFNWGTFDSQDGQIFRFEPNGRTSLLVGHNGSGKSTLVDAITTLLIPARTRNYNVAAGAKKTERTPKSYIRGAYDRTADANQVSVAQYLRPKGTHLSCIMAVFHDEALDKSFTLCQVLYLAADGTDDKVFAIADGSRDMRDALAGIRKSDEVRDHLQSLGYQTTKTYVEYHGWLTHRTKMQSKAMDMFNQTVAVKNIQSLNEFIRSHMLEGHDWKDKVQKLLTHFNDLSLAHQELVRARKAESLLDPIEKHGLKYRQQAEQLDALERQLAASAIFQSVEIVRLFTPEIARQKLKLDNVLAQIARLQSDRTMASKKIREIQNEISNKSGDRLKQIPSEIMIEEEKLKQKEHNFDSYHRYLAVCKINGRVSNEKLFAKAIEHLTTVSENTTKKLGDVTQTYEQEVGARGSLKAQLDMELEELRILERRKTNLPARFTAVRNNICKALNLDESELPFAAELMAVQSEERMWEASIEMVLKSFALSLLVPERYHTRVRRFVEDNRITDNYGEGQRLDYICVAQDSEKPTAPSGDRQHPQSLFRKLDFKPRHEFTPWVRGQIQSRFDVRCCATIEEFQDSRQWSMTSNRHIKFANERHSKDDRSKTVDPRFFVLGWDNTEKKRRIAEHIRNLQNDIASIDQSILRLSQVRDDLSAVRHAIQEAAKITDFDLINVQRHKGRIDALKLELKQLEESSDDIQRLKEQLSVAEQDEQDILGQIGERHGDKALLNSSVQQAENILSSASERVKRSQQSDEFSMHEKCFELIARSLGKIELSATNIVPTIQAWEKQIGHAIAEQRRPLQELASRLVRLMVSFLSEFTEEKNDLVASVESLDSFLDLLKQIRKEDLPRHERKFKDRLNDQVSQEVAVFNTELRSERKKIEEKIQQLNNALEKVEYSSGTFMRLDPKAVKDREIDDFRRSLRECLDESLEQSDEANEARFLRIQKLVERLSDKDKTAWRNKVIDVRNWFDFTATEIEKESNKTLSCYDGSSGQSGGEKAKLAFTILVAALAYQFDIDPSGQTPGRFQFVVVDEMFSKVDDQNAKYALELFKQFGLQLLIVAPLDAKARITEPYVDRYLQVVKDSKTHISRLYSMTAQEYEEVVRELEPVEKMKTKMKAVAK